MKEIFYINKAWFILLIRAVDLKQYVHSTSYIHSITWIRINYLLQNHVVFNDFRFRNYKVSGIKLILIYLKRNFKKSFRPVTRGKRSFRIPCFKNPAYFIQTRKPDYRTFNTILRQYWIWITISSILSAISRIASFKAIYVWSLNLAISWSAAILNQYGTRPWLGRDRGKSSTHPDTWKSFNI